MQKKAILALLLAVCLFVAGGCALIEKDEAVDRQTEIVKVAGQVLTKGELNDQVDYNLNYMSYLYSMFGYSYDTTDAANISSAREEVINSFIEQAVEDAKATELKLDDLTDDEKAEVASQVESTTSSYLSSVISNYFSDTELTGDALNEAATEMLSSLGYTPEVIEKSTLASFLRTKLENVIKGEVTAESLTDAQLQTELDTLVESAKSTYTSNLSSYGTSVNGGKEVYYRPAGYRMVKQILVKFTEEDSAAIAAIDEKIAAAEDDAKAALEEEKAAATAAAYANIAAKADEALAALANGTEWDTVSAQYNEDPGMMADAATAATGYAVCENMTGMDAPFTAAAMALEKVGDVSDKTEGAYGYYIIQYTSDVAEGAVSIDEVRDTLVSKALSTAQSSKWTETLKSWVDAAKAEIHLDRMDK